MEKTILAIAGKPGLYALVSRSSNNSIIVETVDDKKKRTTVSPRDRITSLNDITIYADEDVTLLSVLLRLRDKLQGSACTILSETKDDKAIREFFAEVLPTYDRDRVYTSDIKKMIRWYNLLVAADITDFEENEQEEATEEA